MYENNVLYGHQLLLEMQNMTADSKISWPGLVGIDFRLSECHSDYSIEGDLLWS